MFSEAKLLNSFWAEVFNIVVYVMNLSPAIVLDYDVPNRVWFAKDFLWSLGVFECKACVHVSIGEMSKLDVKTKCCIFIGYGKYELRYRFYDPIDKINL